MGELEIKVENRHKKPFFLGGREHLAVRRSGQCLFLPHAIFQTKGESKLRYSIKLLREIYIVLLENYETKAIVLFKNTEN
ncbi:hypothetical protein ACEOWG_002370 [Bacillus cereus]